MPEGSPTYQPGPQWSAITGFRPSGGSYGAPVAGGGGFKYDEATLHELVKEWRDLAKEYMIDLAEADYIAKARPPGLEYASGDNATVTRESGKALVESLNQRIAYCSKMADKYVAALGKYATSDEQNAADIAKQQESIA